MNIYAMNSVSPLKIYFLFLSAQCRRALLEESEFSALTHVQSRTYKLKCNWKVFVDNFLDGGTVFDYVCSCRCVSLDIRSKKYDSSNEVIVLIDTVILSM